jgi:hypothetical protein
MQPDDRTYGNEEACLVSYFDLKSRKGGDGIWVQLVCKFRPNTNQTRSSAPRTGVFPVNEPSGSGWTQWRGLAGADEKCPKSGQK